MDTSSRCTDLKSRVGGCRWARASSRSDGVGVRGDTLRSGSASRRRDRCADDGRGDGGTDHGGDRVGYVGAVCDVWTALRDGERLGAVEGLCAVSAGLGSLGADGRGDDECLSCQGASSWAVGD